jgi:membrane-associated phospholipid phosphatase
MSEKEKIGLVLRLLPVEKAVLLYTLLTGVLEIFYFSKLPDVSVHLLIRLLIIILIVIFSFYGSSGRNRYSIEFLRVFFPFLLLGFFYIETDYLNNLFFSQNLDPLVSGWEKSIFGFQPSLSFAGIFHSNAFAELMYLGYFSYFLLCLGIPIYIHFNVNKKTGEKFGFIIIASFLAYYVFFIIFPVGGPQFYYLDWPMKLPDGYLFGPLLRLIQNYGERATAAFPSSHVSISIILLMGSYLYAKKLIRIVLPITIILLFSTVYIRAHYVIDAIAGACLAPIFFWLTSEIYDSGELQKDSSAERKEFTKSKLAIIKIFKKE